MGGWSQQAIGASSGDHRTRGLGVSGSAIVFLFILAIPCIPNNAFHIGTRPGLQVRTRRKILRTAAPSPANWLQDSFAWLGIGPPTPPAAWELLPCDTDLGAMLLRRLKEEGDDSFVAALQPELLRLRATATSEASAGTGSKDDEGVLRERIRNAREKERRQRILADLLHLGTIQRLRGAGIEIVSAPLAEARSLEEVSIMDAMAPLPPAIAAEARGYVLAAVPSNFEGSVSRANLAPLLMGAGLYGYYLAGVAESSGRDADIAELAKQGWASPAAFAAVSARVGRLLELPEESDDPLERYASLRTVTSEVLAMDGESGRGSVMKELLDVEGGALRLNAQWLRCLLGELCSFGCIMRVWEQKVAKFVLPM